MSEYEINSLDTRIWEEELDDFVPPKVFDAHVHIYRWAFDLDPNKATGPFAKGIGTMFPEVTWEVAEEVDAALTELESWLAGGSEMPTSWPGLEALAPALPRKGRHGAILLPFRTLCAAIEVAR